MADFGADEPSSRSESPEPEGRGSEDKSLLHQRLAIRELIDTEVSYLHMLRLCASDIRSRLQQVLMQPHHLLHRSRCGLPPRSLIPVRACWKGPLVGGSLTSLEVSPRTLFIVHENFSKALNDLDVSNL